MNTRPPALAAPIVIVVDDDAAVRGSLKFALEIEGFAVHTYGKGGDLFGDADLMRCACFIIDQKLPGMTGLELVTALRERRIAAPAILITSAPSSAVQERAAKAGVAIVEKPLIGNALLEQIRDITARPPTAH